jgi:hypothetical protein
MIAIDIARLTEIVTTALERSAFVFAEPAAPGDLAVLPKCAAFALVRTDGSVAGELHASASEGFLRELAASLLVVDPGEVNPEKEGADALREMANMIAGSVTLALDRGDGAFSLGLPETTDRARFDAAARVGQVTTLVANGEPLRVVWVENARARKIAAA